MADISERKSDDIHPDRKADTHASDSESQKVAPAEKPKGRWERSWPTIACGAGLFSDGYVNAVIGSVNTMLTQIYGTQYTDSDAQSNVASLAFVGTIIGQLGFGYLSDHWSRKHSLLISTIIIIVFSALSAGAYGAGGSLQGMFAALTAYRFLLGIGLGGEYPAGSVACAENTGDLKEGHRNRWFIFFTDFAIDAGFVIAAFVPMVVVLIFGENHLRACWRICLGLGVIPPLSLLYLRIKLKEPEEYSKNKMNKFPWLLILRFYWKKLSVVSLIWFMYNFSSYSFTIYSSSWLRIVLPEGSPLWKTFGWNTVINLFYLPGSAAGAFASDWLGPKKTLIIGVVAQGIIGFITSGVYGYVDQPNTVAAFIVLYGIFLALGEFGPGDNIGLIASKTSATMIRGQYYGIAAAMGKVGAFVGSYVFPYIKAAGGDDLVKQGQYPFFVASALCIVSGIIALIGLPYIGQDTIKEEDARFREFLLSHGYDLSTLGTKDFHAEQQEQGATPEDIVAVAEPRADETRSAIEAEGAETGKSRWSSFSTWRTNRRKSGDK